MHYTDNLNTLQYACMWTSLSFTSPFFMSPHPLSPLGPRYREVQNNRTGSEHVPSSEMSCCLGLHVVLPSHTHTHSHTHSHTLAVSDIPFLCATCLRALLKPCYRVVKSVSLRLPCPLQHTPYVQS